MQAGGHLPSGVSAARSAPKRRGVEGPADGDEGVGDEGAKSQHVGTAALGRPAGRSPAKLPVTMRLYSQRMSDEERRKNQVETGCGLPVVCSRVEIRAPSRRDRVQRGMGYGTHTSHE